MINGILETGKRRLLRSGSLNIVKNLTYYASTPIVETHIRKGFVLRPGFITEEEEESILREINPRLLRRKYVKGHWDAAIVLFREMENKDGIIKRISLQLIG